MNSNSGDMRKGFLNSKSPDHSERPDVDSAVRPSSISSQFSIRVLSIANDPPKLFFSPLRGHSPAGPISRTKRCSRSCVCAAGTLSARHALAAARTAKLVRPPPMTVNNTSEARSAQRRIVNMPRTSFSGCLIVGCNALIQMRTRKNRKIAVQKGRNILFERDLVLRSECLRSRVLVPEVIGDFPLLGRAVAVLVTHDGLGRDESDEPPLSAS
jgi:hypothetical protein